jgi:tetratricopeptide (TPR) repeat protein
MNQVLTSALVIAIALASGCNRGPDEGRKLASGSSSSQTSPAGKPGGNPAALPEGHPPIGGTAAGGGATADPSTLPLKEKGSGSEAELERGRQATSNAEAADAYAQGFRLTFTSDQARRDYATARDLFQRALSLDPNYAEAHRGLAYAEFNLGFNRDAAVKHYKKAIELKPDYGEAHYALAFMYAMDNLEEGAVHFKKALELGIEDERNLGQRFYPTVKIETH